MLVSMVSPGRRAGAATSPPPPPPPAATALSITTQPGGAVDDVAFTQQPVVRILDQYGQNFSQSGVTVTAAKLSGSGTLAGTTTATTNGSGIATFSNLEIQGTGSHVLRFSASGLTSVDSDSFTVATASSWMPNKPAGLNTLLFDHDFSASIGTGGTTGPFDVNFNSAGDMTRVTDQSDDPESPPNAMRARYRVGTSGAGNLGYAISPSISEFYVCLAVKHNSGFAFNETSNKMLYLEPGNILLQTSHFSNWWRGSVESTGTAYDPNNNIPPSSGAYDIIEWYIKAGSGGTGIWRVWVNNQVVTNRTGNIPGNWNEFKYDHTWGGGGSVPTESYRYIGHITAYKV